MWKELDIAKVAVYYFTENTTEPLVAVRKSLDSTFNEKKIASVTDTGIQKILPESSEIKKKERRSWLFCRRYRRNEP